MNRKQMTLVGGGLALVLIYVWWRNKQAAALASSTPADTLGTTQGSQASDYATLAGMIQQQQAQEQGDIGTLTGQEQTDVGTLTGTISTLAGQEQTDIGTLTGTISGLAGQVTGTTAALAAAQKQLAHVMAGQTKLKAALYKFEHPKSGNKNAPANNDPNSNNNHPAGTGGSATGPTTHYTPGAIHAPSGPTKPPVKQGYSIRGLGSGRWEYVKN